MSPTPVPFTPNQLEELGIQPTPLVENMGRTQADRVEAPRAGRVATVSVVVDDQVDGGHVLCVLEEEQS